MASDNVAAITQLPKVYEKSCFHLKGTLLAAQNGLADKSEI